MDGLGLFHFVAEGRQGTVTIQTGTAYAPSDSDYQLVYRALDAHIDRGELVLEFHADTLAVTVVCEGVDPLAALTAARDTLKAALAKHNDHPVTP